MCIFTCEILLWKEKEFQVEKNKMVNFNNALMSLTQKYGFLSKLN